MRKSKAQKQIRRIASYICKTISAMADGELQHLIAACQGMNQTNCWWVEYELKGVLLALAQNQQRWRQDKKRQTKEAEG